MVYKCKECDTIFQNDEVIIEETTFEAYYGVVSMFQNNNPFRIYKCPNCLSESIEEYNEEEADE